MDVAALRREIPVLSRPDPPIYLDNACMTLRPRAVLEAMRAYDEEFPACGDRSVHRMATRVTLAVTEARETCARLIGLSDPDRLVFTRNTTESVNFVRHGLRLRKGDAVVTTEKEHNSNLVPWLDERREKGVHVEIVGTRDDGTLDLEAWKVGVAAAKRAGRLRLAAFQHASNVDGWTMPVAAMAEVARDAGALVLVDAAQTVPSRPVSFDEVGADFLAWSFHKMMGPSGMGALAGSEEGLAALHPVNLGGDTVEGASREGFTLLPVPQRFEGGLQDYAGIIGAAAACRVLAGLGPAAVADHERRLNRRLTKALRSVPGVTVHGPADPDVRGGIVPFTLAGLDGHDVALYLDEAARIAVRSGTHCAHTFLTSHGHPQGWVRASLYAYNTEAECDLLAASLSTLSARLAGSARVPARA